MCILCATPERRLTYCFICGCATNAPGGALKRGAAPKEAPYSRASRRASRAGFAPASGPCAAAIFQFPGGITSLYLPALSGTCARSGHGFDGKNSVALQATGLHLPFERDLRRLEWCVGLRPVGRGAQAQSEAGLVGRHGRAP